MLAKYKGQFYEAYFLKDKITLKSPIEIKEWEEYRGEWYKHSIDINDEDLTDLFDIYYMVEYHDAIEPKTTWCVNLERPVFITGNPTNYEVVIDIDHFAKDDSWQNYEKYAAAKIIKLQDCKKCFTQTVYQKKDNILCNDTVEENLDIETFRDKLYFIGKMCKLHNINCLISSRYDETHFRLIAMNGTYEQLQADNSFNEYHEWGAIAIPVYCPSCKKIFWMDDTNIPTGTKYDIPCENCGAMLMRKKV